MLAAAALAAPVFSTVLVDRPTGFGALPFDGVSGASVGTHALSADGRYLVFSSSNDVLLAGDEDSAENVYRLDRSNGTLVQVNVTAAGGQPLADSVSEAASISADGRYVEFESDASNLVPGGPADGFYVKDMQTGAVELASRATGPDGAAASSPDLAVISGDGRHVAFTATGVLHADNADGAQGSDGCVRARARRGYDAHGQRQRGRRARSEASTSCAAPDIDFGGDAVAFITDAKLSAGDTDDTDDAYVRTGIGAQSETTRFVSFTTGQTPLADTAAEVALSGEGSLVAWSNGFNGVGSELGRSIFMTSLLPAVAPARESTSAARAGSAAAAGTRHSSRCRAPPGSRRCCTSARTPDLMAATPTVSPTSTPPRSRTRATATSSISRPRARRTDRSTRARGRTAARWSRSPAPPAACPAEMASAARCTCAAPEVMSMSRSRRARLRARARRERRSCALCTRSATTGARWSSSTEAPVFGSVPADGGRFREQVIVRDIVSGQTTLVSAAADGSPANDDASRPSLDAAGTTPRS